MKVELLPRHSINLEEWDALVGASPQGTVFAESWFIDAILPEWHGIVVYDGDDLQGIMPLYISQRSFVKYSLQPILAKYWGILFAKKKFRNTYEEYSWKKKVTDAVISAIPVNLMRMVIYFHPSFDYGLPFSQNKFELGTRYTYRIRFDEAMALQKEYAEAVNKKANKARKAGFEVRDERSIEPLMDLIAKNSRDGRSVLAPSYFGTFRKLAEEGYARNQAFTKTVFDENNQRLASSIVLQDTRCAYFLSGLVDPAFRQTGATPIMVTEIQS